jgi:hypothetical protein
MSAVGAAINAELGVVIARLGSRECHLFPTPAIWKLGGAGDEQALDLAHGRPLFV